MDREINGVPRVKNANFRFFRGRFAFVRFLLAKIGDDFGRLPERVIQGSVKLWRTFNSHCFCGESSGLILCVVGKRFPTLTGGRLNKNKNHTKSRPPQSR